jgi:hypothetical protein
VRPRVTYANVMATIAVFIALGGTSYALTLPRNSVGAEQIRSKAVGSSELRSRGIRSKHIRNRSVGVQDLSTRARSLLRGQQGLPGVQGPAGPAGPPGTPYSAAMNSGGSVASGNGRPGGHEAGTGLYKVLFDRDMTSCRATATLSRVPGGGTEDPPAGEITTSTTSTGVTVKTYNSAGTPTDLPFHLIAVC